MWKCRRIRESEQLGPDQLRTWFWGFRVLGVVEVWNEFCVNERAEFFVFFFSGESCSRREIILTCIASGMDTDRITSNGRGRKMPARFTNARPSRRRYASTIPKSLQFDTRNFCIQEEDPIDPNK